MSRLILLNKPFGVLSQFTDQEGRRSLKSFVDVPNVYPAGRLDKESEGLLLLTDDGALQARISSPRFKLPKRYLVQVEGEPDEAALQAFTSGIELKDGKARPAKARLCKEPDWLWPRRPPIRFRKNVPTSWLELELREGRNRQARRMTAAVGFPTLRLIRTGIGPWNLDALAPGEWEDGDPLLLASPGKRGQ